MYLQCDCRLTTTPQLLTLMLYSMASKCVAIDHKASFNRLQDSEEPRVIKAEERKSLKEDTTKKGLESYFRVHVSHPLFPLNAHIFYVKKTGYQDGGQHSRSRDMWLSFEWPQHFAQYFSLACGGVDGYGRLIHGCMRYAMNEEWWASCPGLYFTLLLDVFGNLF